MALAEKLLADEFNRPGHTVVDHRTYVFLGDGCLMEGISHEACSLAGTWRLNKLVAFYDDNGISIDGDVKGWFSDDTPARFEAYGWTVLRNVDGHDLAALDPAIVAAKSVRQAGAGVLQDAHRPRLAQPRRHRQGARRGAGRRRDRADPRGARLELAAVRSPPEVVRRPGRRASSGAARRQ